MGRVERVRFSSLPSNTLVSREGVRSGKLQAGTDCAQVAFPEMVPDSSVASIRFPEATSNVAEYSQSAGVSQSSEPSLAQPAHVAVIRGAVLDRGFSEGIADLVVKSTRQSTGAVYNSKWRLFVDWCGARSVDPLSLPVRDLAEFFLYLFRERSFAVSTIKGYRSAIAGVFRSAKVPDLTSDPDISKLFAGFTVERPVVRRLVPAWNLSLAPELTVTCSCKKCARPNGCPCRVRRIKCTKFCVCRKFSTHECKNPLV